MLKDGAAYETALPSNLIEPYGIAANYNATWGSVEPKSLAEVAYGMYAFQTSLTRQGKANVTVEWFNAPQSGGCFIGVADFTDNVWRWFACENLIAQPLGALAELRTPSGQMLVCLAVTDDGEHRLSKVRLGDDTLTVPLPPQTIPAVTGMDYAIGGPILCGDKPAVAYIGGDYTSGPLNFIRASNAEGTAWETPQELGSATPARVGLATIGGNPAIAFVSADPGGVMFRRAADAGGEVWADPVLVDGSSMWFADCVLLEVNGRPAIVYVMSGGGVPERQLLYIRANNTEGTSWPAAPIILDPDYVNPFVYGHPCAAVIGGNPVVGYECTDTGAGNCYYVRTVSAQDADGTAWNAPQTHYSVPIGFIGIPNVELVDTGGKLSVSWYVEDYDEPEKSAGWFRAGKDAAGSDWFEAQKAFATDYGYTEIQWASFAGCEIEDEPYVIGWALNRDSSGFDPVWRGELYSAKVGSDGSVDFFDPLNKHLQFDPAAKSALASHAPSNKQASCFSSIGAGGKLVVTDKIKKTVFACIIFSGYEELSAEQVMDMYMIMLTMEMLGNY